MLVIEIVNIYITMAILKVHDLFFTNAVTQNIFSASL